MVAATKRPIYATLWFNLLVTAVVVIVLFGATLWQDTVRLPKATGNFGVFVLVAYWAFVFPRLRKATSGRPESR